MEPKLHRILIVLTQPLHPNAGGVQMSTWKMARFFSSQGHSVGVFSFASSGHRPQDFATLYHPLREPDGICEMSLAELQEVLVRFRPNVVINQLPYEHAIGATLSRDKSYVLIGCLRNTLFSVVNNMDEYGRRVLPSILRSLFRNRLGRAVLGRLHKKRHREDLLRILHTYDRFVMFGPPNLDELSYFVPEFDKDRIGLVPNSVPTVLIKLPEKEKRVLWLGRVTYEQKRAELILPIWRLVSNALPDWHLDIVGDGPALEDIRQEIAATGVPRVTIHGRQKPNEYYRKASVFLMTSAYEGFPNTVLEAQSFGAVPVLFNTFPIAAWLINDRQDGILVSPFDISGMSDAVIDIARRADSREIMERALENARRFQIEQVGQEWLELINECTAVRSLRDSSRLVSPKEPC